LECAARTASSRVTAASGVVFSVGVFSVMRPSLGLVLRSVQRLNT
jgi:hypothetical protein